MSKLLLLRQKLNMTQEELSERSGVSVRTIQRIEAGAIPKGYTLKTLAAALGVAGPDLLDDTEIVSTQERKWLKIINLSPLLFVLIPPLNIVAPLAIMCLKKRFTFVTRQVVSIQILMTLLAALLYLLVLMLNDWFAVKSKFMILIPAAWVLLNCIVILVNAAAIDRCGKLHICLNFNII